MASIGIIGVGPRGLSVLERLLALAALHVECKLTIHLIDPRASGTGVHDTDNRDYIVLNTTTNLPTMFPGKIGDDPRAWRLGPSFYDWCVARHGAVQLFSHLPRRLFGEYLKFCYSEILASRPEHVTIVSHASHAVQITDNPRSGCDITLRDGSKVGASAIVLATGHSLLDHDYVTANGEAITVPYPTHDKLAKIEAGSSVGISGMGLSFYDVLAELTVGRGGRWSRNRYGSLRYVRSGREPRIVVFSRSGLPFRARPRADGKHPYVPAVLLQQIGDLKKGKTPLDFSKDIEPLIYNGMKAAFYRTRFSGCDLDAIGDIQCSARRDAAFSSWLIDMQRRFGELDPHQLLWPLADVGQGRKAYRLWLMKFIASDLDEARLGVASSPEKAALEVLFNARGSISDAVSFGGITDESRRDFYKRFVPVMNRNVVGPQLERNEELLVLIADGTVDTWGSAQASKNARCKGYIIQSTMSDNDAIAVDWLCYARAPEAGAGTSELLRRLHSSGYVKANALDGGVPGIAIDKDNAVISIGSARRSLWAIGPICEGSRYYNNYVPLSNGYSICPAFSEAHELAKRVLGHVGVN